MHVLSGQDFEPECFVRVPYILLTMVVIKWVSCGECLEMVSTETKRISFKCSEPGEKCCSPHLHPFGTLSTHKTTQESQRRAIVCKFHFCLTMESRQTLPRVQTHTDGGCQEVTHTTDYST